MVLEFSINRGGFYSLSLHILLKLLSLKVVLPSEIISTPEVLLPGFILLRKSSVATAAMVYPTQQCPVDGCTYFGSRIDSHFTRFHKFGAEVRRQWLAKLRQSPQELCTSQVTTIQCPVCSTSYASHKLGVHLKRAHQMTEDQAISKTKDASPKKEDSTVIQKSHIHCPECGSKN